MKICFVTSECYPFVKTGGLADVSGSLPAALSDLGEDIKIFLPLYSLIDRAKYNIRKTDNIINVPVNLGDIEYTFDLWYSKLPDTKIDVFFIDCPEFFKREKIYTNDKDEAERFILFQNAVIISLQYLQWSPDIIHCNDWQSGLIPAYIKTNYAWDRMFNSTACIQTIHNIVYQGRFAPEKNIKANFVSLDYNVNGAFNLEESFCFLKAGIHYSEIISTVSPTYAVEIKTPEYGAGLETILHERSDDVYGILNGIDVNVWNPGIDKFIHHNYTFDNLTNKINNKISLTKLAGLKYNEHIPLIGIVSRFAWQKGFDLLEEIFDDFASENFQLVVLGEGEDEYKLFFNKIHKKYRDKVFVDIGYNDNFSHHITAGSDIFLMPSKYEPCGLNQMYSLNYGTIPIVRKTGGLADTVRDIDEFEKNANGFCFEKIDSKELLKTLKRALKLFTDKKKWNGIMQTGMREDFSWNKSARKYLDIYKIAKEKRN
jgi:starch synthase